MQKKKLSNFLSQVFLLQLVAKKKEEEAISITLFCKVLHAHLYYLQFMGGYPLLCSRQSHVVGKPLLVQRCGN